MQTFTSLNYHQNLDEVLAAASRSSRSSYRSNSGQMPNITSKYHSFISWVLVEDPITLSLHPTIISPLYMMNLTPISHLKIPWLISTRVSVKSSKTVTKLVNPGVFALAIAGGSHVLPGRAAARLSAHACRACMDFLHRSMYGDLSDRNAEGLALPVARN